MLGIQAGRGVAALLVVLYHAERGLAVRQYLGRQALGGLTAFGHAGVDFFFVLSGFIIYYVHRSDLDRPAALPRYVRRRACRIYPAYWAVTVLVLLVNMTGHGIGGVPGVGHIAESLALAPPGHPPILGVAWTLQRELVFYVLFGLAIVDRRWALLGVAACIVVAWGPMPAWVGQNRPWGDDWYDLLFLMGIVAARITLGDRLRWPYVAAALGVSAFLAAGLAEDAGFVPAQGLIGRLAYGLSSACLIAGIATAERRGRLRVGPALVLLGAASYSIYLVHDIVLGYAARLLAMAGVMGRVPGWFAMVLVTLAAVAAGLAFHWWIERPLTHAARRVAANWFGGRERRAEAGVP